MTILLSVCFPTYNRAAFLKQSLTALLSQLTPVAARHVEIVISNNMSTDHTREVVQALQLEWTDVQFVYVEQPESLGADNVYFVTEHARGEFVLIVSDDDILLPGAVDEVLRIIHAYPNVAAISLNVAPFRESLDQLQSAVLIREADRLTSDPDEVMLNLGTMITFLSAIAYRRDLIAGDDYAFARHRNLIQSYAFVGVLTKGTVFYLVKRPYIAYRDDNSGGWNYFNVYVDNYLELLEYARGRGIGATTIRQMRDHHLRVFLRHAIVHFKTHGSFGSIQVSYPDVIRRLLRAYGPHTYLLSVLIPLIVLPSPAVRSIKSLHAGVKRLRSGGKKRALFALPVVQRGETRKP